MDLQAKFAGQALGPIVEGKLPNWLIYIVSWVWCYIGCGYFATAFVLLSFDRFHKVYASMYYCYHVALVLATAMSMLMVPKPAKKSADSKVEENKIKVS